MNVYKLINPFDAYTFEAPNLDIAGAAVALLSANYGAVDASDPEQSAPIMFGWNGWLKTRGIDDAWVKAHVDEIATALESVMIGSASDRDIAKTALRAMAPEAATEWLKHRHNVMRSSMNDIGAYAIYTAEKLRAVYAKKEGCPA